LESSVAELLIQVAAEKYLGYTAHDAVLAQTLWLSNGILSQSNNVPDILDLCLGVDFNFDADTLPADIRQNLVNRCLGISKPFREDQAKLLNKLLNHTPGLDFETYVARCNYSAFWGARALARVTLWVTDHDPRGAQAQGSQNLYQKEILEDGQEFKTVDVVEHISPAKYTLYDRLVGFCGNVYHYIGTFCKFFSIAFVADGDYQRELRCTFPGDSHITNAVTRFMLLSIWTWAKTVQQMFLPLILVSTIPQINPLQELTRYISSINEIMFIMYGRTFREWK